MSRYDNVFHYHRFVTKYFVSIICLVSDSLIALLIANLIADQCVHQDLTARTTFLIVSTIIVKVRYILYGRKTINRNSLNERYISKQAVKLANINFFMDRSRRRYITLKRTNFFEMQLFNHRAHAVIPIAYQRLDFHIYSSKKIYAFKLCEECLGIHSTNNDLPFRYIQAFVTLIQFV